jgi:N-acetylglucosamine-6-sulfatase
VLTDDLSGCMHVNSTGYIFQNDFALFPLLQSAGYITGGFGKIINGQGHVFQPANGKPITNGWDWLSVPLSEGDYFTNLFFNKRPNGSEWVESLGSKKDVVDEWYQTSQIGNRSIEFIRHAVQSGKPFTAYLGPHAPHYSADAPPWARTLFSNLTAPRTPAYNTSIGQADKTKHVAQNPPISVSTKPANSA